MRVLSLLLLSFVFIGLIAGLFFNNLWRFMPEYNTLDSIFSVPLYLQILLLALSITTGLFLYKKINTFFLSIFFIFSVLTVLSWYNVVISNATNSLVAEIFPFYTKEIKFSSINRIKATGRTFTIFDTLRDTTIYTGFYPFGLDHTAIWDTLQIQGNCLDKINNQCIEIEFVSP
jgi:hypothetical protein